MPAASPKEILPLTKRVISPRLKSDIAHAGLETCRRRMNVTNAG